MPYGETKVYFDGSHYIANSHTTRPVKKRPSIEEEIVYSKGLYQYFISDILEEDIVCKVGQEYKKLLLF